MAFYEQRVSPFSLQYESSVIPQEHSSPYILCSCLFRLHWVFLWAPHRYLAARRPQCSELGVLPVQAHSVFQVETEWVLFHPSWFCCAVVTPGDFFHLSWCMSHEEEWLRDLLHWLQFLQCASPLEVCLNVNAMVEVSPTFTTFIIRCYLRSEYLLKAFIIFSPLWVPSCRLRAEHWLKDFPQRWHSYGFSPVWVLSCRLRAEHLLKAFPHRWHSYGCSPVCVLSCCLRLEDWLKAFPQRWHSYGFSPVCVRLCFLRSELWIKAFPQIWHSYGFSPVWVISCLLRLEQLLKAFPHRWHSHDLPLVWICLCWLR